jgi:uncharacterized protein with PQ loop repeat
MLRSGIFAVVLVTVYLFTYNLLLHFETTARVAISMLVFSPFLVCWMVYAVLKHEKYSGRDLGEDEFGYQDKPVLNDDMI